MTGADQKILWKRETERLMLARSRFLDSLNAIQELAEFAVTQVEELDKRRRITLTISSEGSEEFSPGQAQVVAKAAAKLFQSMLAATGSIPPDVIKDINKAPEDVRAELYSKFDDAFAEFEKSVPSEVGAEELSRMISIERPRTRMGLLLSSLLIAAVSDFEVVFSSLAAFFYHLRPEALRSQDTKVSWQEIEFYNSIEELRNRFIDDRVDRLMRDGLDEWIKWLDRQLKIQFDELTIDRHMTHELFQRRHIIVHNGGLVSPQYRAKVNWLSDPPAIGAALGVSREYLSAAIDELATLGASLTHLVMRKLCPDSSQQIAVDEDGLLLTFHLLNERQWKPTQKVSSIILPEMTQQYNRTATQVNEWIARKRLAGLQDVADEVKQWDVSALDKVFRLAQLALLDDQQAVVLARELMTSGELTADQVNTWPLFEEMRSQIFEA
jgi:hypothetical protein